MSSAMLISSAAVCWFGELGPAEWAVAGGKGASLARLRQSGLPVPDGFVVLPSGFVDGALRPGTSEQVRAYLAALRARSGEAAFAVRSSAAAEDSAQASFAGEFSTILDVRTDDEVLAAIREVYDSRHNERATAYSQARGLPGATEMAVVVQQLIAAERSGILFTANPITGRRKEAVINAAWGLGEAVVGGLVTPDTLTVDRVSGQVLRRETADKQVMTVRVGGGTAEQPVPAERRREPVLADAEAAELVRMGARIEGLYGVPVDVEWAMVGREVAVLQARPITALPEPEPDPPTRWVAPAGAYALMRNNIVELMADPLSPLFGTLGLTAVNASIGRELAEFFGQKRLLPPEIIITINDYAYFNGSLRPGQIASLLWQSVGIARRMFSGAIPRWLDEGRPRYLAAVERWQEANWQEMSAQALVQAARELTEAAMDAFGVLDSGAIPGAWISEGLFTFVYDRMVKGSGDPPVATFLLGYNSTPIRADKSLYDLAAWAGEYAELAEYLERTPTVQIAATLDSAEPPAGVADADWQEWRSRFRSHLRRYGHMIYNLDFATPVPADEPAPLIETCKMYLGGQGVNPQARQLAAAKARERATADLLARSGGWRLRLCRRCLLAAQRYALVREDGQAELGLAYPPLRRALRELGRRCSEAGMLSQADDIFWLTEEEVTAAAARLDGGESLESRAQAVEQRKAALRAARRVAPPRSIMQLRLLGRELGWNKQARAKKQGINILKGVAASPGRATARASVVSGPEDFAAMHTGDVLVAPLTTPAWTPLFARASAIVTDVGGPLSHGSIVAREYGIPAVLGTGEATKRIRSGQTVTVDGSAGEVELSTE